MSAVPASIEFLSMPMTLPISCIPAAPDSEMASLTLVVISDSSNCLGLYLERTSTSDCSLSAKSILPPLVNWEIESCVCFLILLLSCIAFSS